VAGAETMGDLYELLGVRPDATDDEIKRAYRRRARELHPDANGGDPEAEAKFKEVSFAYEVLRDPERRARYDRFGAASFGGAAGPAAGGMGFGFDGGLGDLFEAFFGTMAGATRGRRRGPQQGSDAEVSLQLDFAEAVFGAEKQISVRLPVGCADCGGSGAKTGTQPVVCSDCQGTGELRRIRQSLLGQVVTSVSCTRCQGSGEVIADPCETCRGEGRRMEDREFTVEVPAGVDDGSTLRLAGRGPAGPRGGPNGSLFVHLAVQPDERFERLGDDLHTTLHVGMAQAALGTALDVETLEEPRQVTVAAGTQTGTVVRIRGLGVPHLRGRGRGDLYVHLAVDTPTELTSRQRELLAELALQRGEEVHGHDGVLSRIRSALG
jgi:molecular chaperone DnaJ